MTDLVAASARWLGLWEDAFAYGVDAWQRNVLFLDVLRRRGNQYHEHMAQDAPTVLTFDSEVVLDGRTLPRPVNYSLTRIVPPAGVTLDPRKRPFVIVDPRAGHGPGIAGFKPDSEIGVALRAGHACYFLGFLPRPEPQQTVEDVVRAEAAFLERVIADHPEAEGKPVVIGNCQAGWQIMMGAALRPELFGPIIIAGAPLSYWAGWRGMNPMRYLGGLMGGTWATALAGDLGAGLFDGSWLVHNFENLNPANTWWSKQFNVWSRIDTEASRYLGFEKWWNGHVLLNAEEMQYIADNLFVGNRLTRSDLVTSDGTRIDLRNIRSPVVVFCSRGDNITPPPQALGWITDLYKDVADLRAHDQTIVYAVHDSIGHLGIFVSGAVAKKEHEEFASNIDFIDVLPPGLYEAEISLRGEDEVNPDLLNGDYVLRFATRTLDDVRAIVENRPDDEKRFGTAARVSSINLGLYRQLMRPWVQAVISEPVAEWLRQMHPLRLRYDFFSDRNPLMAPVAGLAQQVQAARRPVGKNNLFCTMQSLVSAQAETSLERYQAWRDALEEQVFLNIYGQPLLQAMVGLDQDTPRKLPANQPEQRQFAAMRQERLRQAIAQGGAELAELRAIVYVGLAERQTDERTFTLLRRLREEEGAGLDVAEFKQRIRDQFQMLLLDPSAALATLPKLLDGAPAEEIERRLGVVRRIATAGGPLSERGQARLTAVERIFRESAKATATTGAAAAATATAEATAAAAPDSEPEGEAPLEAARKGTVRRKPADAPLH